MAKSTLTREWLQHQISAIEAVGITDSNTLAAFKLALAAMDSEPMHSKPDMADAIYEAFIVVCECHPDGVNILRNARKYTDKIRHAQPAPVVPDGYVTVPKEPTDEMLAAAKEWTGLTSTAEVVYIKMLAAAPHDTPALNSLQSVDSVTGGWIPVSERMPEDRISVILWDAEIGEVTSGHYSHKTHTFYHCGDAIENEITHWMPPPAAPQEVK